MVDRPRVLLIWPGGMFGGGGNFGVPQILSIAAACRRAGAEVDVVDLDMERAFGQVHLETILAKHYDLVGISCYSSYDYLKVLAIGERVRQLLPRAWLATGGYHASARPGEFASFDYVIPSDGERGMARLVNALITGRKPLLRELPAESVDDPNDLDPTPWDLLSRYQPVARRVASQAEIYLSRGCPYDCAFCMERAKRDVSWRSLEPERAVEEMHRLDSFLDLSKWTLFVADALFGMKRSWRREFLEGLIRRPIRAKKIWLLIRLDLLEREDLKLMARANIGPGFGLESGDPEHLKRIRKAGRLHDYLDQMMRVADWCHEEQVPFGANIIVGHPGETEKSLRTSAKYLSKLFLGDPRGTMGFLSVDPFRLYPGSPIDEEHDQWVKDTGMHVHRRDWWHDGDQDFLSEWVDPSSELDFRTTHRLRHELFTPIVQGIQKRFAYQGPARDYFMRSIDEQVELIQPRRQLRTLAMHHMWKGLVADIDPREQRRHLIADRELAAAARATRETNVSEHPLREALLRVPRERFVREEDIAYSGDDRALLLGDDATISAMHAYLTSFSALELQEGDRLIELGGGTGYGAAVAAEIVGATGSVVSYEIDEALATLAEELLLPYPNAQMVHGDAHALAWRGANKVSVAFAVNGIPQAWIDALAPGGVLVAPVIGPHGQVLTRVEKADEIRTTSLSRVMYVRDRSPAVVTAGAAE
jgi:protein-L-isoaspartate(D-aspartate) O-methyltransferase